MKDEKGIACRPKTVARSVGQHLRMAGKEVRPLSRSLADAEQYDRARKCLLDLGKKTGVKFGG